MKKREKSLDFGLICGCKQRKLRYNKLTEEEKIVNGKFEFCGGKYNENARF